VSGGSLLAVLRRGLGAALFLFATLPVYRVLSGRETGLAGAYTTRFADIFSSFLWTGALLVILAALLASRFLPVASIERVVAIVGGALRRPRSVPFALLTGAVAFTLSTAFVLLAMRGHPNQIDAISQLLHARFFTLGMLSGPADVDYAFWHIQNSVVTPRGWVSQYPPGHVVLLALGLLGGVPWIVGPVMVGAIAFFTTLIADRLLPERRALARTGSLLVSTSAFVVCLGGSFMNHAPAAALLAAATWFSVRAVQDGRAWAFAAGAAVGFAFTIRPLTALSIGAATAGAAWLGNVRTLDDVKRAVGLVGRAALGASPFVLLLAAYNRTFFGHPTRFGYNVALGPGMSLGFGRDPWGNAYGPVEALGYTAADLLTLGSALLETPVSAVAVVGLFLLLVRRLSAGERVLAAWALLPVATNALYWHHGMYMGPRMLYEAAPAWILLAVLAAGRAYGALAADRRLGPIRISPRAGLAGGSAFALALGLLWLGPQRALSYVPPEDSVAAVSAPETNGPALVFVHDGWTARIAMQLAGAGMRLDSVETALRQNPTCDVQALVDAVNAQDAATRDAVLDRLDFEPRASDLPPIVQIATGNMMRVAPDAPLTAACVRQARADRNGILDVAPLVWRGDLSGGPVHGALFVRDLGPERNARLIARMPERVPMMLHTPSDMAVPQLHPYEEAVRIVWGESATAYLDDQ